MAQDPVVVVGARCAGAAVAMLLARAGQPVVLLDRARFPSDTLSTHWILRPGIELLDGWGLLGQLTATGCPPIERVRVSFGSTVVQGAPAKPSGQPAVTYAPRRTVLDNLLVEAAGAAGAEVRTGVAVRNVLTDDGTVNGVAGFDEDGRDLELPASLVIGADGRNSTVARAVDAGFVEDRGALAATCYGYWSGLACEGAEIRIGDRLGCSMWPTHDGLTVLAVTLPRERLLAGRDGAEATYRQALAELPELGPRLAAAELRGPVHGAANLRNYYRSSHGPGWVLIGDAVHHKDPIGSRGISDAFADAAGVASAWQAASTGRLPLQRALDRHRALRSAATAAAFEFICTQAALQPLDAETERLMRAVSAEPAASQQLVSVFAGARRFEEFFAAANLEHILAGGTSQAAG